MGGPGLTPGRRDHLQSLMDHNFAALLHREIHNTSMERSKTPNVHSENSKDQQDLTLSNRPHLHRAYALGVFTNIFTTVISPCTSK